MSVTVTCECGHVTELAESKQPDGNVVGIDQSCPECGRNLSTNAPAGKRMFQQLWQSHVGDKNDPVASDAPASVEESVAAKSSTPRRSLWDVMRGMNQAPSTPPEETIQPSETSDALAESNPDAHATKPKSLWELMRSTPPQVAVDASESLRTFDEEVRNADERLDDQLLSNTVPPPVKASENIRVETPATVTTLTPEQKYAQAVSLASMTHVTSTWRPEPGPEPFDENERIWSRRAVASLVFAVLAMTTSAAAYRQEWWWRGPALITGLTAACIGFVAAADVRQSRGRLKGAWIAKLSIVLGMTGMFLAPLVFGQLGDRQRANAGLEETHSRLKRIGEGLDQYHAQQQHFPESAIKGRDANGDNVPMHGWMTSLLPMIGHDAVYRRIDLKQPFDAAVNVPAMQQPIPEFSLPRRKPSRSPRGFGLAHFSGVGGQDVREPAGLVHFGLFDDSGPVKREQITDGLSQTLIIGEIRDRDPPAPPWGEPGNVRSIGEGLNRQFRGFGNANGTGATFLHADGSVKFYSNKIDRRVLERLETRDGGESE